MCQAFSCIYLVGVFCRGCTASFVNPFSSGTPLMAEHVKPARPTVIATATSV